jgi:endonuclease-3
MISVGLLRRKVRRIVHVLELSQGVPVQSTWSQDVVDVLVATILSQNTNDRNSALAYRRLKSKFTSWEELVSAPVSKVAATVRVGGLANRKAATIKRTLVKLKKRHGSLEYMDFGQRTDEDVLKELPAMDGVGVKTAACVLLFSLKRDVFPVDTHIHRICNRLGIVETKSPEKTFSAMKPIVPKGKAFSFHVNLIQLGREICLSRRPNCGVCHLNRWCDFAQRDSSHGSVTRGKPSGS